MEIFYEFNFDAAHRFDVMPEGHKYRGIHGHSFQAEVAIKGEPSTETGFVVDFARLEEACAQLRDGLDHRFLNEIEGLSLPSLENIARWIWQKLKPEFPGLCRVVVRRASCHQGCIYTG